LLNHPRVFCAIAHRKLKHAFYLLILAGILATFAEAQSSQAGQKNPPNQPTAAPSQSVSSQNEAHTSPQESSEPTPQEENQAKVETTPKPTLSGAELRESAWKLIHDGLSDKSVTTRAAAVRSLALLKGESRAISAAKQSLHDKSVDVRSAGALALGDLQATSAIPQLKEAISDKEPKVVLAAAHSLVQMKDPVGYEVYYAILTGQRKSGKGAIAGEFDTLKDPKKLALLGFEEGIGYVPFGSIGYAAVKTLMKDSGAPGRADSARALEHDPDPESMNALSDAAVSDKSELVRATALETLSKRNDPIAIESITPAMYDDKELVKFTAAATILHLFDVQDQREHPTKPKAHLSKR
jgi:HEAT repeat protein